MTTTTCLEFSKVLDALTAMQARNISSFVDSFTAHLHDTLSTVHKTYASFTKLHKHDAFYQN
jgi:hypothetical protein